MADNPTLNAAIPAAASVINSGINAFAASNLNKKTREFSREMYQWQRNDAISDYNTQNEYNSPTSQMARLKQAGLNPNLVYGNGNAVQTAANVRPASAPAWNPKTPDIDITPVGNSIFNFLSAKKTQAEIDNLKKLNTVMDSEKILKDAQTISTNASTAGTLQNTKTGEFQLGLATDLRQNSLQMREAELSKLQADTRYTLDNNERAAVLTSTTVREAAERILHSRANRSKVPSEIAEINARIKNLSQDTRIKQLDADLKSKGIQPHDALWQRSVAEAIGSMGSVTDKIKEGYNKFTKAINPFKTQNAAEWQRHH